MAEIVSMPKLGFDMAEGTLVRWVKSIGDSVSKGDVLAEIETDKATVEVESSFSGVIHQFLVEQGSIVPVGTPIVVIAQPGEEVKNIPGLEPAAAVKKEAQKIEMKEVVAKEEPATAPTSGSTKASPLAKRMASEIGLDLSKIKGTGPGGRVVKRDIEQAASAPVAAPAKSEPSAVQAKPWMTGDEIPADQRMPMDKLRSIIGKRMVEAKQQVPHFYITHEYRAEPVMRMRKEINEQLPEDQKLSVNDFIIKAVALTLRQFPNINASIQGNDIVRHGHVNVGVAVALDSGLITVVSKDADVKPLRVISREIKEMVGRARQGKVRPEDIEGSTFSISNLGMFDVEHFIAIINPPEAAILAVGSVKEIPVVENGEIKVGQRLKATISADHRITDGAEAAKFMQVLAGYLENPLRMLV